MSVSEYINDKRLEWRFHSTLSHNRVLGKGVWQKLQRTAQEDESTYGHRMSCIRDLQMSMETEEEWQRYVGEVARNCPPMPRSERLIWVLDELYRRSPK